MSAVRPDRAAVASTDGWLAVATDGSALGNPGPGGWAWAVDDDSWAAGGVPHTTNNIMELTAIREALAATAHLGVPVEIQADSSYCIDALTKWIHGWRRRNWRTASGSPVANRDLIEEIGGLLEGRQVRFVWVRGHAGHAANEHADARARAAAGAAKSGRHAPAGPGLTRSR